MSFELVLEQSIVASNQLRKTTILLEICFEPSKIFVCVFMGFHSIDMTFGEADLNRRKIVIFVIFVITFFTIFRQSDSELFEIAPII